MKTFRLYQKKFKTLSQELTIDHKDTELCEEHWLAYYPKVIYYGKERPRDSFFLLCKDHQVRK